MTANSCCHRQQHMGLVLYDMFQFNVLTMLL
jgi:hypothetical protein